MAANPPDYERAKAQLARLHSGRHSAAEWQACSDAFRKAHDRNPKWRLRSAALYRHGVALEGRFRVTRTTSDARRAATAYEQTVRSYPDSALADDALFRSAQLYNEHLREPARARSHLERIASRYPKSDHAKPAAAYLAKMGRKPEKKRTTLTSFRAGKKRAARCIIFSIASKVFSSSKPTSSRVAPISMPPSRV
jgi:tetratricopeptide (TPR) repeat protein